MSRCTAAPLLMPSAVKWELQYVWQSRYEEDEDRVSPRPAVEQLPKTHLTSSLSRMNLGFCRTKRQPALPTP